MKHIFIILSTLVISICSCQRQETPAPAQEDPDWIRIEIPASREAYAITGDIDKTLLVTTWTKAYYSTDRGKTWQESKDFHGRVPGLLVHNDTVFALEALGQDIEGNRFASLAQYFTADYGHTWYYCSQYYNSYAGYNFYSGLRQPLGIAKAAGGITYRIKENLTPVSPGATSFYINPSELQKEDGLGVHAVRFPFKHMLTNLYLDASNRLYVTASGGTFDEKTNTHYCCDDKMQAIVYVSRKPLP